LAAGHLDRAIDLRQRQVALLEQLSAGSTDVDYREKLVTAHRALGNAYAWHGDRDAALASFRTAIDHADGLVRLEPTNRMWRGYSARARLDLANLLLSSGDRGAAEAAAQEGCAANNALMAQDSSVVPWRSAKRDCLTLRTQIALGQGNTGEALSLAGQALRAAKSVNGPDPLDNLYSIARSLRFVGDVRFKAGDPAAARTAWQAALSGLPAGAAEKLPEISEHAQLLDRLGRGSEAKSLRQRMESAGYRQPA